MKKYKYYFNDKFYNTQEEVDDAICDYIVNTYPEEVHSDYLPEESELFINIWQDEVEIIES